MSAQQTSLTLDFSSTEYLDIPGSTADWDTVSGTLHLPTHTPSELGTVSGSNLGMVSVDGNHAYTSGGTAGLRVFDVSDVAAPSQVYSEVGGHIVVDVDVYGNLLFAAGGTEGLHFYDVTNPASPVYVGANSSYTDLRAVAARGALLFLANGVNGIQIVNLAGTMFQIGSYNTPGTALDVDAGGGLAVVADNTHLRILDVTDPSLPVEISSYAVSGASSVVLDYPLVYLGTFNDLLIFDISDPTTPVQLGSLPAPDLVSISVDRDYAAVTTLSDLYLVDVRNPSAPGLQWSQGSGDESGGAVIRAGRIYWADGDTFRIVESALPISMLYTRSPGIARNCFGAAVEGNILYLYQERNGYEALVIYDVTDAMNPVELGHLNINTFMSTYGSDLAVSGGVVYLADRDGIKVVDARNPTAPVALLTLMPSEYFLDVAADGSYLVAGTGLETHVFALYDPASPTYGYALGFGTRFALRGSYLYYTSGSQVGVFNLFTQTVDGIVAMGSPPQMLAVEGNEVYVGSGSRIYAVDVSDPTSPAVLGTGTSPSYVDRKAVIVGDRLVLLEDEFVTLFDISDPANITEVGDVGIPRFGLYTPYGREILRVGDFIHVGRRHVNPEGSRTEDLYDIFPILGTRVDYTQNRAFTSGIADLAVGSQSARILPAVRTDSLKVYSSGPSGDTGIWSAPSIGGGELFLYLYPASSLIDPMVDEITEEWAYEEPVITSITDTPNDQGKQVRLSWMKTAYDLYSVVSNPPATEYSVYRRIEPNYAPGVYPTASPPGDWDFMASVPADGLGTDGHYSVIVPTLADSTISAGMHWTTYFVRARTATAGVAYESAPDSGYSVDNLAPSVPAGLLAFTDGSGFDLTWDPNPETDLQYYNIYRGASEGFVPDELSRIGSTAGNTFNDPSPGGEAYYKVTAIDFSGNEGDPAVTHGVTGVGYPRVTNRYHLYPAAPNPFRSGSRILYEVPAGGGDLSLAVYDVQGREVRTLRSGWQPEGVSEIEWNGRDDGGREVPVGVYFLKLSAPGYDGRAQLVRID